MPIVNGIGVLKFNKKNKPKIKVNMMSAYTDQKVMGKVMEFGTDEYI
jgi:YesN/AraC family two-component response regulator